MIKLKPQEKWPPLVGTENMPVLIRIRDMALTFCAWAMLGYLMRDFIYLSWDYLSHPIFELTVTTAPDWHALWLRLRPYAGYVAALTAWLLFWAFKSRKTLSSSAPQPQPPVLTPEEHALTLNLNANDLRAWQTVRNQIAHFDENGTITKVTQGLMR